ncbi:MAG: dihydroorotate dehydrogenase (NAD+) catalytic subunit [Chlamydiales bacterium]|jgi:dihydroorotate dehydrogenase (NAD+) catalytic subunit
MIYDIYKSYAENVAEGPFFDEVLPKRVMPPKSEWVDFLGVKLASRVGVPAGPLLTSKWTNFAGDMGFDIVTYKTIRSKAFQGHPLPNVIYLDIDKPLENGKGSVREAKDAPDPITNIAITNSFGMPSQTPEFLMEDIARGNAGLREGQVLVVSVVGGFCAERGFIDDFVYTAKLAKEAGAKIVEANFSCPNVSTGQGQVYLDVQSVFLIASRLVEVLGDTPLIIKVASFPDVQVMENVFIAAARAGARAVAGINTISKEVVNKKGEYSFGADRPTAGVCGAPIRKTALNFIREGRRIIEKEKLDMQLVGVGGITKEEHFLEFIEAGADVAQTATGMMWNPWMAMEHHQKQSLIGV